VDPSKVQAVKNWPSFWGYLDIIGGLYKTSQGLQDL